MPVASKVAGDREYRAQVLTTKPRMISVCPNKSKCAAETAGRAFTCHSTEVCTKAHRLQRMRMANESKSPARNMRACDDDMPEHDATQLLSIERALRSVGS